MQPRIQEQRRWARTALEDPENLSLCYTDSSGKLQLTQVSICDVSGGGLGVISPLALPVGAYISTGGSANGASAAISARRATVASCRPLTKGTFGIGLAYQQLDPDAKSRRIEGLGIWHSAVHGQSLYVNQPMCEMLEIVGWEDLGGKTYELFVGGHSRARYEKSLLTFRRRWLGAAATSVRCWFMKNRSLPVTDNRKAFFVHSSI